MGSAEAARAAYIELKRITDIIERVDNRCMAADGPVTPTRQEITDKEMRSIYLAARRGKRALEAK
jgi:hypothetical protein